ncbi:aromatic-ring-hydroxylating dioxygenase subunit beta [Nocardioides endophyticus]|uniref:Aromatic-ring-hydroxylating dioxygenase subunit beta n=1 Tax=Nocardioides endophyticus TaxID=1353775 RepID=A0ABP8YVV9_9ACTN
MTSVQEQVEQFLFHEVALLDHRDWDTWLELYADDATYSIPQGDPDHARKVSIVFDDKRRLVERVIRLKSGFAYSQEPSSITVHLVGNVMVVKADEASIQVASSLMVTEVRRGRQTVYAALVSHTLRPSGDSFLIAGKEIRLANSEVPLGNLTFIV